MAMTLPRQTYGHVGEGRCEGVTHVAAARGPSWFNIARNTSPWPVGPAAEKQARPDVAASPIATKGVVASAA